MKYETYCNYCGYDIVIEGVVINNFDPEEIFCEECGEEPLSEEEKARKAEERRTCDIEWLRSISHHFDTEAMKKIVALPGYADKGITMADLA